MRLICTIKDDREANPYAFSYYLTSQGIENQCEEVIEGGVPTYRIWIYDEDTVEKAQEFYKSYQEDPQDPRFKIHSGPSLKAKEEKFLLEPETSDAEEKKETPRKRRLLSPAPYGTITVLIILAAITLFILSQMQKSHSLPPKISGVIQAPLLSPLEKSLLFDYPLYFALRDELLTLYTPEEIAAKKQPSADAKKIIQKLWQTPVWMGFYDKVLVHFRNPEIPLSYKGPLFEKIQQGQVWRFFTPSLLHFDLLHIFFNLVWFILLGNQIEFRLGKGRYLLLVLATALISNTAQYLMSGTFFMGLSGIVIGLAAFIWARQQIAPWEGYLLNRFTLIFLAIFVIGMFALQVALFFMQIYGKMEFPFGIANTAHLAGGLVGYLLGRSRLFAIHPRAGKH